LRFIELLISNIDGIREMSKLASTIVKDHYDPILGEAQNDYMIDKFQSVNAIKEQLHSGYKYYFVVNEDGKKVGFIALIPKEDHMYLSKFYLHKDYRGKGIAKEMLDFIIERTKEAGLSLVVLNVNKYNDIAIRAYEKLGFIRIREEIIDIGSGYYMDDFVYSYSIQGEKA